MVAQIMLVYSKVQFYYPNLIKNKSDSIRHNFFCRMLYYIPSPGLFHPIELISYVSHKIDL